MPNKFTTPPARFLVHLLCLTGFLACTDPSSRAFGQAAEIKRDVAKEEEKVVSEWMERFRVWLDSSRKDTRDSVTKRAEEEAEDAHVSRAESRKLDEKTDDWIATCLQQILLKKPAQKASKTGLLAGIAEYRRAGSTRNSVLQTASAAFTAEFKSQYSTMANAPDKTIRDLYDCALQKCVRNPLQKALFSCAVKKIGHPEAQTPDCLIEELIAR